MRTNARTPYQSRFWHGHLAAAFLAVGFLVCGAVAQNTKPPAADSTVKIPPGATVESLFHDFLHYARMGRFTLADAYAQVLLAHPELDPVALMEIADKDKESLQSLLVIIRNSSISETAQQILALIQQGEFSRRKSADRILINIDLLGGDPQQEWFARRRLAESGEYAIPLMVATLLNPRKSDLWPRVINALPAIGKPAVNPLVIALNMTDNDVRLHVIQALGEIGYPQAVPYLRKLVGDDSMPKETRDAASTAIERIEEILGRSVAGSAADLFVSLALQYYEEDDAVRADPRLDQANTWYWNAAEQELRPIVVSRRIFGQVMAMRCCGEALRLKPDHAGAIAMWLAANIRREARLDMNVESGDPAEVGYADATRPDVFPRALYFTQAAGPRYAHLVLDRAVQDRDSFVALGAIEALRITAGESSLIGTEDYKQPLVRALQFPDQIVRIRAALALGAALPRSPFAGSELVMPLLASALRQTGREQVLVIDADEVNLNRIVAALRSADRDVIGEASFFRGLERVRTEFQRLSGVFVSTGVSKPGVVEGLRTLRGEFLYSKTPVVLLTVPGTQASTDELASQDPYVEPVDAAAADDDVLLAFERVRGRTRQAPIDEDLSLSIALQAAETLRRIAANGRTVFDPAQAEPSLIAALSSPTQELQILAASVLAMLETPTAQRAIAHVALDDRNDESLRVAAFGALADSAKDHGRLLEEDQITHLVEIAHHDPNLVLRTAASQALGAVNLSTEKTSEIIRSYFGG